MLKYSTRLLFKLEDIIRESDYILRYEKGNFKAGHCLLKEQKIMVVNKFVTTEGKINAILDMLKSITLDSSQFSQKTRKVYDHLVQDKII